SRASSRSSEDCSRPKDDDIDFAIAGREAEGATRNLGISPTRIGPGKSVERPARVSPRVPRLGTRPRSLVSDTTNSTLLKLVGRGTLFVEDAAKRNKRLSRKRAPSIEEGMLGRGPAGKHEGHVAKPSTA